MSDLFGNHIVGFPTRRLKYCEAKLSAINVHVVPSSACTKQRFVNYLIRFGVELIFHNNMVNIWPAFLAHMSCRVGQISFPLIKESFCQLEWHNVCT